MDRIILESFNITIAMPHNIKRTIHATAILAIILFCVMQILIPSEGYFHNALYSVDASALLMSIAVNYLWFRRPFSYYFKSVPVIFGKWTGTLRSDYNDETKNNPIQITFYIKQSLFDCSIRTETNESISHSLDVCYTPRSSDSIDVVYSYKNEPGLDVQSTSRPHYGTTILHHVSTSPDTLTGCYFTDRNSSGTIQLSKDI